MVEINDKSKDQLSHELNQLRQRVSELEASETKLKQVIEELRQTRSRLAELQDSEERYRSVVTAMAEGVVMQTCRDEIVACNPAAEQILGWTLDQMMGRTSLDPTWRAIHEDGSPFLGETHPSLVALQTGKPQKNIVMGVHKPDGSLTWLSINAEPMFHLLEAEPYAVITTFNDITDRQQAEQQILTTARRLSTLIAHLPGGILLETPQREVQQANQRFCDLFGIPAPPEMLIGADCRQAAEQLKSLFVNNELFVRRIEEILNGQKEVLDEELSLIDGRVFQRDYVPIKVANGEVEHLWHYRDITEPKQAEVALQASERKLRQIIEQSGDAIALADETGRMIEWNGAMERLTGLNRTETLGQAVWDVQFRLMLKARQTPTVYEHLKARFLSYFQTGQLSVLNRLDEVEIQHVDGTQRMIQTVAFSPVIY